MATKFDYTDSRGLFWKVSETGCVEVTGESGALSVINDNGFATHQKAWDVPMLKTAIELREKWEALVAAEKPPSEALLPVGKDGVRYKWEKWNCHWYVTRYYRDGSLCYVHPACSLTSQTFEELESAVNGSIELAARSKPQAEVAAMPEGYELIEHNAHGLYLELRRPSSRESCAHVTHICSEMDCDALELACAEYRRLNPVK